MFFLLLQIGHFFCIHYSIFEEVDIFFTGKFSWYFFWATYREREEGGAGGFYKSFSRTMSIILFDLFTPD